MRDLLLLAVQRIVTLARLSRPGGVRSVIAESPLLKQQLIISRRSSRRAPLLTTNLVMDWYWWAIIVVVIALGAKSLLQAATVASPSVRSAGRFYLSAELKKWGIRQNIPDACVYEIADEVTGFESKEQAEAAGATWVKQMQVHGGGSYYCTVVSRPVFRKNWILCQPGASK